MKYSAVALITASRASSMRPAPLSIIIVSAVIMKFTASITTASDAISSSLPPSPSFELRAT